ncbi:sensor histidine kinase [Microbacterium karelineae]|uniref:sensor histidine kinase n=1 Tax=Microbacterium karelineae TaxID=2654283 RepID=UPI001E423511|nr:histidine kinase [Microbacterium karelineae]
MPRSTFRRIGKVRLAIDIVLAVIFFALTSVIGAFDFDSVAFVPLIAAFMSAALAVRRLNPALSLAIAWAGAILQMALGLSPLATNVAIFGVLYVTAAYGSRLVMWIGLASAGVGSVTIAVYVLAIGWLFTEQEWWRTILMLIPIFGTALFGLALSWTAGALVRALRRARENREAQSVAEAEARAEHERVRIARDMHDVVAHSLAVIVAQADGARYAAAADPSIATDALGTIGSTARSALSDVRMLLAQLRHQEAQGPQPTIADIDPLLAQVRQAGVELVVDIDPAPQGDVPAAVQLAVYRILQEALTNALRHGDGGAVDVALAWHPGSVNVMIRNGTGARREQEHQGHGIIGMRERAQLAGGTLEVEHLERQFVVRAHISWADLRREQEVPGRGEQRGTFSS